MDDLLREFLTETNESLDTVDVQLVRFEQDPNDKKILDNIFRLVHTIKGTCGFLGLPRLEALAHAAETLMGKFRDGMPVTGEAVTLILCTIDRLKQVLDGLERQEEEPTGSDTDLIGQLEHMALHGLGEAAPATVPEPEPEAPALATGSLTEQTLERPLRPGEVSLDELERAFRETAPEVPVPAPKTAKGKRAEAKKAEAKKADAKTEDDEKAPESLVKNQSIRVNVETLEHLMTMVSELVLTRNQLLEIVRRHEDSEFKVPLQRLSNVTAELQEGVMKTRMQPIGNAWQKLPRVVRDLANELGKSIELETVGAETELDRQVLDLIKDPLTHMVRNSADHGLEGPEERRANGKSETGTIRLSAFHEGGHIIIEIADDGRGLHTEKIKAKAIANGLINEVDAEKMSENQIQKFIFAPGFSTAAKVTSVSGRGVGMDVVRTNIDQIGGAIDLKSVYGEGTTVTIKIPLTLAIVSALIVEAGGDRFAIPQLAVVELVRAQSNSEHRIERIKDTPVLRLRNKLLPLVHLKRLLKIDGGQKIDEETGFIVVTQVGNQTFGIVVDGVFHTEEIVVKPMSSKLRHIPMFSGNTILGDGSVIMIIDPNGISSAFGAGTDTRQAAEDEAEEAYSDAASQTISLLVFRAGSTEPKAVPLSLVTRLEEIDAKKIERSNGRWLVQYRGSLMPLVTVNPHLTVRSEGTQPMLVFSESGRSMGLVVDEIVDIVEDRLNIEVASEQPGVLGSAVIKGQATEVIDIGHYLPMAFEDWMSRGLARTSSASRKLLFVDDSPFFRNMLTPVLRAAGYDVVACVDGEAALQVLKADQRFDAVVADVEMPGMDGFELAEQVKTDPRTKHMPMIALSSVTTPSSIERGRQAGFDDHIAKFDRQGLIAALKECTVEWEKAA
ncbi:chemotaxis protein CheW [Blastochloris viridis]|uniref:Chemotaxis protein CheA n=1 Tax=Blastochloris viridis TaxID=1079 RepID=A0A0H5BNY8_BLAVI|nr:chemotaxis protein CheW [Blastochloris viridis]ALK08271.1 Chemotaxis protein CheA [Blastochloris viridis]BAR98463.1 signal transduction histidine kinase CheA [Blastochloris viridis]CUU44193.1 Chemotaxis protein CheA [Blastochloris viridis]